MVMLFWILQCLMTMTMIKCMQWNQKQPQASSDEGNIAKIVLWNKACGEELRSVFQHGIQLKHYQMSNKTLSVILKGTDSTHPILVSEPDPGPQKYLAETPRAASGLRELV